MNIGMTYKFVSSLIFTNLPFAVLRTIMWQKQVQNMSTGMLLFVKNVWGVYQSIIYIGSLCRGPPAEQGEEDRLCDDAAVADQYSDLRNSVAGDH